MLRVQGDKRPVVPAGVRDPHHPITALRDEVDRLFDSFFAPMAPFARRMLDMEPFRGMEMTPGTVIPRADIWDTGEAYEIATELPGLDDKDVEVTFSDGLLTVKGEKREEKVEEDKERNYYLSERRYGAVHRAFHLPEAVREDDIAARFEKGVLYLTLPKEKKAAARKIEVHKAA